MGLAVEHNGNVYVADAGNRRLLRIAKDGSVRVVYRLDPPYFPTGVFATRSGDVYVLEFRYTPPGTTDKPRVRKISPDGHNRLITSAGLVRTGVVVASPRSIIQAWFANVIGFVNGWRGFFVLVIVAVLVTVATLVWRRHRTQGA
jgi:hypothetical protein